MPSDMKRGVASLLLLAVVGCSNQADHSGGGNGGVGVQRCEGDTLCAGASRQIVTPSQAHIDGLEETRLLAAPKIQKFNLGGYGIDPTQNFPDPVGALGDSLTVPAAMTHYEGSRGAEHTWIRAMAISEPDGETVLFLVLDAVGAGNVIQAGVKQAVSAATGIAPENVLFGQTHTHAGADLQGLWGGVPQDWIENILYPQAVAVATQAVAELTPVTLEIRHGHMPDFNNFRRPKRIDPEIDADTLATLLQARARSDGRIVASLMQFAAHPTSINEEPRTPHPDYVLGAMDYLEKSERRSGGVALYFNGPIADASSSGSRPGCEYPQDENYGNQRCKGEGMAQAVMQFDLAKTIESGLSIRQQTVYLPVTNPLFVTGGLLGAFNRYYDFLELPVSEVPGVGPLVADGLVQLPQLTPYALTAVSRVTLGGDEAGLEMVTIPGEATGTFGQWIRSLASPDAHVMLLGLTQNSFGYIIPEEEFSYINASGDAGFTLPFTAYEEFVSLGPLTAPLLRTQGYIPLFDADPVTSLPPYLATCESDPADEACILHIIGRRIDYLQSGLAGACLENGGPEAFCALVNPDTPLAEQCLGLGLPPGLCEILGTPPTE